MSDGELMRRYLETLAAGMMLVETILRANEWADGSEWTWDARCQVQDLAQCEAMLERVRIPLAVRELLEHYVTSLAKVEAGGAL